jgi:hypothetical protein
MLPQRVAQPIAFFAKAGALTSSRENENYTLIGDTLGRSVRSPKSYGAISNTVPQPFGQAFSPLNTSPP